MYKIIGADGKEYGPISQQQVQQWLAEGRLNTQSKVLAEGETEWKTIGELPEFAAPGSAAAPAAIPAFSPVAPDNARAKQLILGPAIFILVVSILDIIVCLIGLAGGALQGAMIGMSDMPPEAAEFQRKFGIFFSIPSYILGIVLSVVCLIGSIKMMKLKAYGLAMATAIIMLIPCGTCCCFLNIGAGIWALIILSKPEVKAAFQ